MTPSHETPTPPDEPLEPRAKRKRRKKPRAPSPVAVTPLEESLRGARALLAASAAVSCLGVAIVGTGPSELGAILVLAGLVGLLAGVHLVGRMGPA